jgi:hypothetical protein
MDEKIVALAKAKADQQGKSLDALAEEELRLALQVSAPQMTKNANIEADLLDASDLFFSALDEIRNLGRMSADRRTPELEQ